MLIFPVTVLSTVKRIILVVPFQSSDRLAASAISYACTISKLVFVDCPPYMRPILIGIVSLALVKSSQAAALDPCTALCNRDGPSICTGGSWTKGGGICHAYLYRGDSSRGDYCYHTGRTAATCPASGAPVRASDVARLLGGVVAVQTTVAPVTTTSTRRITTTPDRSTTIRASSTRSTTVPRRTPLPTSRSLLLRERRSSERRSDDSVSIFVSRVTAFADSVQYLLGSTNAIMGYLSVTFRGETGYGAGVTRDWFATVTSQILNRATGVFRASADDPHYVEINPSAPSNSLRAVGRFMALSIAQDVPVPLNLPMMFYVRLLGQDITLDTIKKDEPLLFNTLTYVMDANADELAGLEITIGTRAEAVTVSNRQDVVRRKLRSLIPETEFNFIRDAFNEVIPNVEARVTPQQLKLIIEGEPNIDVELLLQSSTIYSGNSSQNTPNEAIWLYTILRSFNQSELRSFLRFVTGNSGLPHSGGSLTISISPSFGRLPRAATCFKTLYLYTYSSEAEMRRKLLLAINEAEGLEDR